MLKCMAKFKVTILHMKRDKSHRIVETEKFCYGSRIGKSRTFFLHQNRVRSITLLPER